MRLSSLKLSGFKSFADSTTLHFKDNRTAVVGPNGCGKSNVIDAIRWVMGESSARQLRGGSMQDVIFTGTAQRKPVGMASVELRFDNTYGKLGGAYNAYTELAVRRQVTRDGKSEYFLNGTRCRRKDITDIFLGTGLGPRSYAVIEQGMISRLVDAKPDEMRVFIEEAAGVSRYQARRKETLQHLEQAEHNLARLHDIDSELEKQLKALERQVKTALQYKQLESEIHTLKVELLSYQLEQNQQRQTQYQQELTSLSDVFKDLRVELHKIEAEFQHEQSAFQQLLEQSAPLQDEWKNAEKRLAELTAQVVQKRNLFEQTQQQISNIEQHKEQDSEKVKLLELQLEQLYEQAEHSDEQSLIAQQSWQNTQQQLQDLKHQQQQQLTEFNQYQQQVAQYQQQQQQLLVQQQQLQKNSQRLQQQQETLLSQRQQLAKQVDNETLSDYLQQQQQLQHQLNQLLEQSTNTEQQYEQQQQQYQQVQQQRQQIQAEIKILQAEQNHLQQLLVKTSAQTANHQHLFMQLELTESAKNHASLIEKALADWLHADIIVETHAFKSDVARQICVNSDDRTSNTWHEQLQIYPTLATWIKAPQWQFFKRIIIIEQYADAIALQHLLQAEQQILTLDGYLLGMDWQIALLYDEPSQTGQGIFSHRIRLQEVEQLIKNLEQQLQQVDVDYQQQNTLIEQNKQHIQQCKQQHKHIEQQLKQLDLDIVKLQSQQHANQAQQQQLTEQYQQIEQQLADDLLQLDDWQIDTQAIESKLEQLMPNLQAKQLLLDDLEQQLEDVQQLLEQQSATLQTKKAEQIQCKQDIELLEKDYGFLSKQVQQQATQYQQLQSTLLPLQMELPSLQQQLDNQAKLTVELQTTWQVWQDDLNIAQQKQQQRTELRQKLQQQDEDLRQKLEDKRLAWQSVKSDIEHQQEQLHHLNAQAILGLSIDIAQHQTQLVEKQEKFDKIGAVNLIASEEYQDIMQRHNELSHQISDVETTVTQLREAMKNIDQETKSLFMNTFDKINRELQVLFPKVFNGGEASLTLEDDWQSGVKLMARPPGKRNSSLALLSGGEKALTALALVFAIFRLNPAPFCVLDEVDAPLDDANVQRFCNLVTELSQQVQFIYITHNKLAMTMATDLLGVTMPEAGTSKLVAVNIEQAKEFGLMSEQV